jgi:hypothetical protein
LSAPRGAAPIAYQGQLIVSSGYGFTGKMSGNALLVFEVATYGAGETQEPQPLCTRHVFSNQPRSFHKTLASGSKVSTASREDTSPFPILEPF